MLDKESDDKLDFGLVLSIKSMPEIRLRRPESRREQLSRDRIDSLP